MDTSAGKATTEEQKKKHCDEGRCFECSKQGHLARDCPTKKLKACSTDTQETEKKKAPWSVQDMVARATKFSDEERTAFIQALQEEDTKDEDPGFLEA